MVGLSPVALNTRIRIDTSIGQQCSFELMEKIVLLSPN